MSGLSANDKRFFQLRTFLRVYCEFVTFFFKKKNYNLNNALVKFLSTTKKGRGVVMRLWLLLYGCQQQDLDDKLWELFFHYHLPLADTPSLHCQPSRVLNSYSPILQVTAIPPRACGLDHTLIYLFPWPMLCPCQWIRVPPPWWLCPSYLPPHITDSSRSTHLFFTSAGQIHCIPLLPHKSFDLLPYYPTAAIDIKDVSLYS